MSVNKAVSPFEMPAKSIFFRLARISVTLAWNSTIADGTKGTTR